MNHRRSILKIFNISDGALKFYLYNLFGKKILRSVIKNEQIICISIESISNLRKVR